MEIDITSTGFSIDYDSTNNTRATIEGTITQTVTVEMPNPNADYYFSSHSEWLNDYTTVRVNGREWELDLRDADLDYYTTPEQIRDAAEARAAEDFTTTLDVLVEWATLDMAPREVQMALDRERQHAFVDQLIEGAA